MDKLKLHTSNKADENYKKLAALFPNAVTETIDENGEVVRAIDKDILMQEIAVKVVEGREERYQFTWPDKKKAILTANAPISKTLRPCREESVDFDNTENLYIEGDNLDVLKLLQETYLGKIKMIYIDPPYNTGNDFVYNDDFAESASEYLANSGQFDDEGNRLVANTESNGRFHTDWLNMIYPRLKLAKDLLADDGVIFISIDDNEVDNIRKICSDIFGENNFLAQFLIKGTGGRQDSKHFAVVHQYAISYTKNINEFIAGEEEKEDEKFPFYDEIKGLHYKTQLLRKWGDKSKREDRPNLYYPIIDPDGNELFPMISEEVCGRWRWGKEKMEEGLKKGLVTFSKSNDKWVAYEKIYEGEKNTKKYNTWVDSIGTDSSINILKDLFGEKVFDYPKPVKLIKLFTKMANITENDIVLDFFSGSATTAHAVMQLNAEDGGNRKFIMVQLPEETDEKSEAYKAGYKNICEIGKERIRRAGEQIKNTMGSMKISTKLRELDSSEKPPQLRFNKLYSEDPVISTQSYDTENLDVGFRVLKLDTSNMKDVYYNPSDYSRDLFDTLTDNIKEDRTPEDLLFQIMLDLGVLLSSKIEESVIAGKKVFSVADGFLVACFDENVTEETITAIAKMQPYYFVMRDSSMANDSVATNFDQLFATYSPDTVRKVL